MEKAQNNNTLQLKEEQPEIKKNWVKTGEVSYHQEVLTEEKTLTVPVRRQDLVIEKKVTDPKQPGRMIHADTIRVPIREERIDIVKNTFDLETVDIYKKEMQHTESVNVILKREELLVETEGKVNIEND